MDSRTVVPGVDGLEIRCPLTLPAQVMLPMTIPSNIKAECISEVQVSSVSTDQSSPMSKSKRLDSLLFSLIIIIFHLWDIVHLALLTHNLASNSQVILKFKLRLYTVGS